jgi:pentatricopeptide repeat protein
VQGQPDRPLSLLREMEARGRSASEYIYNATITACGRNGGWEQALRLLNEMDGEVRSRAIDASRVGKGPSPDRPTPPP